MAPASDLGGKAREGSLELPSPNQHAWPVADVRRIAKALSGVKRRINHPKLPEEACYAGVAYQLPEPPRVAAELLLERLGPLPAGMSLDRIDPFGHYVVANLRYATPKEQTANRRPIRKTEFSDDE